MEQDTGLSKGERRRQLIVNTLKRQGKLSIQEIVELFDCSEATARRDLDLLEKKGALIRNLGGALLDPSMMGGEQSFIEKKELLLYEKEAVAMKAASLVEEGDSIGLTGGTTTYLIARALKEFEGITVVTNAVNIAMELADCDGVQVLLTGGVMRRKSYELCGPLAEKVLESININKMFMGIDGIAAERGVTTYSELEAEIARLMMRRSLQTYAVFDYTKLGKTSLFPIAPLSSLHGCITNEGAHNQPLLERMRKQGMELHLAGEERT
ncbi:DeoR/GlpR family DNA-binding transcription regulator [Paenibacillus piri]|uniref:DeoR/GlpR transcriptional regulator n=1 Tax=Paenibacillus piri TaxID=2547395 RepID=A0A4R5KBM7_9BACL|nr:DeoR/GlpR family DNA-binding transcription regulator [Paenibacillus piri]TDF92599.1 DeoR/GlpR transcriptional regulator [Paenibacillus piri]